MAVPLQAYKDALPILQTQYDALSLGPYTLKIEPINGLDVFYSDGSAQNYDGKIVLYEKGKDYSHSQYYFRQDGLVYRSMTPTCDLLQSWIQDITHLYLSKQKE